jgi:S-adenosylmethionine:tRNA ribosyltransferase-isomerase
MKVDLFDFELPPELIALRPVSPRDSARQLIVRPGGDPEFADDNVANMADHLRAGDVLVFNDTRVIPGAAVWPPGGAGQYRAFHRSDLAHA